jgi:hypothetical protein
MHAGLSVMDIQKLLTVDPLYTKIDIDQQSAQQIVELEFFERTVDCFCMACGKETAFLSEPKYPQVSINNRGNPILSTSGLIQALKANNASVTVITKPYARPEPKLYPLLEFAARPRSFVLEVFCPRNRQHRLVYAFTVFSNQLSKVGQYPSLADLKEYDLRKYRPLLTEEQYREFARAVGLVSHGIGIGAFVYLRRIFEDLVEEAHDVAKRDSTWNEDEFQKVRMEQKILSLRTHLPEFLVEKRDIYGILSKGIHDLSENECLAYFDTMRIGIELILEKRLAIREQEGRVKEASKEIARIKSELKR